MKLFMKVSVIVPIYNLPKYLRQCVDSVLCQNFDDFEVILVDDGSTDECVAIVDEYAAKDSRIKAVHKENGGLSSARNAGLDVAEGEFVIFLDSDDWWNDVGSLSKLYDTAVQNDADVVRGEYRRSSEDGKEYEDGHELPSAQYHSVILDSFSFLRYVVRKDYFPWLYLIRRASLKDVRFDEAIKYQEDVDFVFHLLTLPLNCIYTPFDFLTYRSRIDSMIRLNTTEKLGYYLEIPFCVYSYGELCDSAEARLYYTRYAITAYQMAYSYNLADPFFYKDRYKIIKHSKLLRKNFQVICWIVKWGLVREYFKFFLILLLTPYLGIPMFHYTKHSK